MQDSSKATLTEKDIEIFLKIFMENRIEHHIYSEISSKKLSFDSYNEMVPIVAHNFHREVFHTNKTSILQLYRSNSSQENFRIFSEKNLGTGLGKSVKFLSMNTSKNKSPLHWVSIPTIYVIYSSNSKTKYQRFEGEIPEVQDKILQNLKEILGINQKEVSFFYEEIDQ